MVVVGCALSALGGHSVSVRSLLFVSLANVCFSLRAILGKRVTTDHGTSPFRLLFQMCAIGGALQLLLLLLPACRPAELNLLIKAASRAAERPFLLLANGVSFYAQMQLSFVCLTQMTAVSHSLANSMRRPVTIAASLWFEPARLTSLNWVGILLACAGATLYGIL